jgi:DNA-binding response OmpR family regulator
MPKVLTVDDSRAIRQIVSKELQNFGCETEEAEDGEKGLARLEEIEVDLILLDVTMPVMDGPAMLEKLRANGNKTPVIMLTSESKRSIIAQCLKLGIEDYVLKPFKAEELRAKVQKVIRLQAVPGTEATPAAPAASVAAASTSAPAEAPRDAGATGKQFVDVLVIDDMENVQKKLRSLLPQHISLNGCVSAQAAVSMCREKVFRVVLLDTVIPDVNSVALMNQLRALQGHANFVALMLRTAGDADAEVRGQGYDGHLFKPFDAGGLDDFINRYFDNQELITVEANVLNVATFAGKDDRLDKYLSRVGELAKTEMEKVAAACYDDVVVNCTKMPMRPDKLPRFMIELAKQTARVGLSMRVVGPSELTKILANFTETKDVAVFASVSDAQAAAQAA